MSKHLFQSVNKEQQPVKVDCGFDRILQHFYLTVFSAEQEVLYTSLMERSGGFEEVDPLMDKLEVLGIQAPDPLAEHLWLDQALNEGNGTKVW